MKKFFESNPGLNSRFNTLIEFSDYNAEELEKMLISMCNNNDYVIDDNAFTIIREFLKEKVSKKDINLSI